MMLNQKKSLMMLLTMISLSGCKSAKIPDLVPVERCGIFLTDKLDTSVCRCQEYEMDVIGGKIIGESVDMPITYCDRAVVFNTDSGGAWETIVNWRDAVYRKFIDGKARALNDDSDPWGRR